jgi:hypothetical protein
MRLPQKAGADRSMPQIFDGTSHYCCKARMEAEVYKGYAIWGHAILEPGDILQPERYAGSGTITKGSIFVETSGVLGSFETEEAAQVAGLAWAHAWIDSRR